MNEFKFDEITGYYLPYKGEYLKGTIYCYHGWGSNAKRQLLRGDLFTRYGFEVILPDAVSHGKRGRLNYSEHEVFASHFFQTIRANFLEFDKLSKFVESIGVKNERVIVLGHSMGAYTASALLGSKKECKEAILLNGSLYWSKTMEKMISHFGDLMTEIAPWVEANAPEQRLEDLRKKHFFAANGMADETVSPLENQAFLNDYQAYLGENQINFYQEIGHQVSEKMLFDALKFIDGI